jgi:predicted ribosomally synthesized peptide with SipW-like signal peptide
MRSIRNAVLGCALAAGVPPAFAYFNASDNASSVQAHAWAKFAAPLAAKLK